MPPNQSGLWQFEAVLMPNLVYGDSKSQMKLSPAGHHCSNVMWGYYVNFLELLSAPKLQWLKLNMITEAMITPADMMEIAPEG